MLERGDELKRDINIIKYVLEEIERLQDVNNVIVINFNDDDYYSVEALDYHFSMLLDAGFVDGAFIGIGDDNIEKHVKAITWQGHDLLDVLRNDEAMELAEEEANKTGSKLSDLPIDIAQALIIASVKKLLSLE